MEEVRWKGLDERPVLLEVVKECSVLTHIWNPIPLRNEGCLEFKANVG